MHTTLLLYCSIDCLFISNKIKKKEIQHYVWTLTGLVKKINPLFVVYQTFSRHNRPSIIRTFDNSKLLIIPSVTTRFCTLDDSEWNPGRIIAGQRTTIRNCYYDVITTRSEFTLLLLLITVKTRTSIWKPNYPFLDLFIIISYITFEGSKFMIKLRRLTLRSRIG